MRQPILFKKEVKDFLKNDKKAISCYFDLISRYYI